MQFKIVLRESNITRTQVIKNQIMQSLLLKLREDSGEDFDDLVKTHAPWFNYQTGKIRGVTQQWNTSKSAATHLCIKTRSLTMEDIHLINRYLKEGKSNG